MENNQDHAVHPTRTVVYNPRVKKGDVKNLHVLRVTIDEVHTRIDLIYYIPKHSRNDISFQIDKDCYINPDNTTEQYFLIRAENIAVAPQNVYARPGSLMLSFSLYFQALDKNCQVFDLIESEEKDKKYFNIYRINVNRFKKNRFLIMN
jgi:hypothetical protein